MTHRMKTAAVTANTTFIAVSLKAENVISLSFMPSPREKKRSPAVSAKYGVFMGFYNA